jgi:hypothetical protein
MTVSCDEPARSGSRPCNPARGAEALREMWGPLRLQLTVPGVPAEDEQRGRGEAPIVGSAGWYSEERRAQRTGTKPGQFRPFRPPSESTLSSQRADRCSRSDGGCECGPHCVPGGPCLWNESKVEGERRMSIFPSAQVIPCMQYKGP